MEAPEHRESFESQLGENGPDPRENLFTQIGQRLRDVRQGPDGLIYFTTDDEAGVVMRIERGRVNSLSGTVRGRSMLGGDTRMDCPTALNPLKTLDM